MNDRNKVVQIDGNLLDDTRWNCVAWDDHWKEESDKDYEIMLGCSHDSFEISLEDAKIVRDTLNQVIEELENND